MLYIPAWCSKSRPVFEDVIPFKIEKPRVSKPLETSRKFLLLDSAMHHAAELLSPPLAHRAIQVLGNIKFHRPHTVRRLAQLTESRCIWQTL